MDYKTDEQLHAMPHADLVRYTMHLQLKHDEEAGGHAATSDLYRELWNRAWAVCKEQAALAPSKALLELLRTVQSHLGSVPPTCGCDACDLERRIVAALKQPQARLEGYQATIAACRAALAGVGAPAVHAERLDVIAAILRTQVPPDPILHQLEVRHAVLALDAASEPDDQYDPSEDLREEQAGTRLAELLGSIEAARGIGEALHMLRYPPQPSGEDEEGEGDGPVLAA